MKNIEISCFGHICDIPIIAAAGYDAIEMHHNELVELSPEQFAAAKHMLEQSPLRCRVVNNPFPLDKRICVPSFNLAEYEHYVSVGVARAAELGALYLNFGNGYARTIREDCNSEADVNKITQAIVMVCGIARQHGMIVLLEPLARPVSNIVTTLSDAFDWIEKLHIENLKTFVDMRWQVAAGRPFSELYNYAAELKHAHIDNPNTDYVNQKIRIVPKRQDTYDYSEFLDFISSSCYTGALSIEAHNFSDMKLELEESLALFAQHELYPLRSEKHPEIIPAKEQTNK